MTDWKLAQVRPNADKIAIRNLVRQGFRTFQPLERFTVVKGDRFIDRLRPYFSGYVFVSHPHAVAPWSLINSTYGISRLVRFGDCLASVPASLVAELEAACDEQGIIAFRSQLTRGSTVCITQGSFTGFVGQIERLTSDHRALILIEFLGKHTRATLPIAQLQVTSRAQTEGLDRD